MINLFDEYYEILKWDSDFFGFTVAKITPSQLGRDQLEGILCSLRRNNVHLVYWASDPYDEKSQQAALANHGYLADKKKYYVADLNKKIIIPHSETTSMIEEYTEAMPNKELISLAIQSGAYSRYNVDINFPKELFCRLYEQWIYQSVNKAIADAVFVATINKKNIGMITVRKMDNIGQIGLFAVDQSARGQKIGINLIAAAHEWFIKHECRIAKVITQGDNIAGRRLYEGSGYKIERTEFFYHFWL